MRVLIVGGLGYIGSALIEHYKRVKNRAINVDILDKRFVPHLVANLPENFYFVQGDMKESKVRQFVLKRKPDVIYLLAAEVHAEKSILRERAIWENNFEAMVRFIEKCSSGMRLIYPSTGNVFGGIKETSKNKFLTEEDPPSPKYPYAESKRAVEGYLLSSKKNFTICRLGTNYGYAPGVRFDLVTNNFIRKALIGENILIHGNGRNFRPTVCVKDSVRAMLFLSRLKESQGEIFHIVCENFTIRDLAKKIISFVNSSSKINYVVREVPFSSYHLSNQKLLRCGFRFMWNLNRAVKEMSKIFASLNR